MKNRLAFLLWDIAHDLAEDGEYTQCAAGFYEMARDIGPLTFLYNTEGGEIFDIEVQFRGRVIFHGSSYQGEEPRYWFFPA